MGRNQKRNKKAKLQTAGGIQQGRMDSGKSCKQWHRAKFRRLRKFRNLAKFLLCSISFVFSALLSFWSLIYNAEFDSNSLCLDRLNNFSINSLQNYKISHKMRSVE